MIWVPVHQFPSQLMLRMPNEAGINSPTPEIGLKFCICAESEETCFNTTMNVSTPIVIVLIHLSCASLLHGARRHLQPHEVARVVQMLEDGFTQRDVAAAFGVSQSVVSRAWNRYVATGGYNRRPGQGRLRCTTARQDRYIRQMAVRRRQSTARALQIDFQQASGRRISDQTVRNRLHEDNLQSRRPARGPILTREHRRARLVFAQDHQHWQLRHWRTVLFTDESRFHVSTCDRRVRVWRRAGERYAECNIVEYDRYGGGSVMVWGGICLDGRTDLLVIDRGALTAVRYRDEVLHPVVRPFAGALGPDFVLMQDNARPHTARVVQAYLDQEGINTMEWPARSPDLNPIEHLWDLLQRRVSGRQNPPQTVQALTVALREEWNAVNQDSIRRLIRSMPRRCRECIQSRGGHTSY